MSTHCSQEKVLKMEQLWKRNSHGKVLKHVFGHKPDSIGVRKIPN